MASVSFLPKLFRWVFTALEVLFVVGAICISVTFLIDPKLPPGTHFGPLSLNFGGQPGSIALNAVNGDSDFTLTAFRGSIVLFVEKAGGLIEVAKAYGLPMVLISTLFFIVVFDLLRRLFRNVSRGQSFTRQSVALVQFVGGSLIVYSIVSAFAEGRFFVAMLGYLSEHAVITVSGTSMHLPAPEATGFAHTGGFPFNSPVFYAGLLVLALSEVFRQGLALKSEHDLTV
jgi:hypothetical protein